MHARTPLLNAHLYSLALLLQKCRKLGCRKKEHSFFKLSVYHPQFSVYNKDQRLQVFQQETGEIHRYQRDEEHRKAQGEYNWFGLQGTI